MRRLLGPGTGAERTIHHGHAPAARDAPASLIAPPGHLCAATDSFLVFARRPAAAVDMFLNPWYGPAPDDAQPAAVPAAEGPVAARATAARTPSTSSASSGERPAHETPDAIQRRLRPGWTVHTTPEGRLFYCK